MSTVRPLLAAFLPHLPVETSGEIPVPSEELAAELARVLRDAHAAWPTLSLPAELLLPFVARRLPPSAALPAALRDTKIRELALLCAFVDGQPRAAAALESEYLPTIDATLARMNVPPADRADLRQVICQKLLIAHEGQEPRIARYSGRGDLRGWLAVVSTREARELLQRNKPEAPVDPGLFLQLVSPEENQELAHFKERYRGEFMAAFAEALASLEPRDRNILRHHLVGGLNIEQIGTIYHVHRATVARWIERIRPRLLHRTRKALTRRLGIQSAEVESVLRLIDSRLGETMLSVLHHDD